MDDQRQGATRTEEETTVASRTPIPLAPLQIDPTKLDRGQRKFLERKNAEARGQQFSQQLSALKGVAEQINGTAQLAVRALHAVAIKEISLSQINVGDEKLIVVGCEPGRELADNVCDQLIALFKCGLIVVPKDMDFQALKGEALASFERKLVAMGWEKKKSVTLVGADGQDVSK